MKIILAYGDIITASKLFGVSTAVVSNAINYRSNSDKAKEIREYFIKTLHRRRTT